MIGGASAFEEHNLMPPIKLIDFGLGTPEPDLQRVGNVFGAQRNIRDAAWVSPLSHIDGYIDFVSS